MSTIVTRAGKGSPLTNNEVDANFVNLNTDKVQVTGTPTTGQAPIWNGTAWVPGAVGAGTVTSVAATAGTGIAVTGSPITSSGTLNITNTAPLPTGGTTGQVLAKNSTTNYDAGWIDNYSTALQVNVKAGVALTKGQAVYITGAVGANIIVGLAQANTEATSSKTFGLINATLAVNDFGNVICEGPISGINTSTATEGDAVWLSPTVPGGLVFGLVNKPVAPDNLVYLGVVSRAHATQGQIQVKVQNGFELQELHNVLITSPTGEYTQELAYQASTGLWKNYTKSTSTVAEGTNLYYTDARVRLAISGSAPLAYSSSTGVFSIPAATSSVNGYLTSTDWSTFNGKQAFLVSGTNIKTINGSSVLGSGDLVISGGDPAGTAVAMAIALG